MIFPWKKNADGAQPSGEGAAADKPAKGAPQQPQPEKAAKFLQHAGAIAKTGNNEYALQLFANAIKLDPGNMAAHNAMYESAVQYIQGGGKPATGKELKDVDDGSGNFAKLAAAEFIWMKDLNNLSAAMKLLEFSGKLKLQELGQWLAPRVLNLLRVHQKKKPNKKDWVLGKDLFSAVNAWNEAFFCGEAAVAMDPSDGALIQELKQLTAARAIQQGGYNKTAGQEGGFRANIKDAEKQKQLTDQDAVAGTADVEARNLERAKKDYEERPEVPEHVQKYATLLRKKQTAEGEDQAHAVYMDGFTRLGEYRFRMAAGDIRIAQSRRTVRTAQEKLAANPADAAAQAALKAARDANLELEGAEFAERMEKYPTDCGLKAEVGRIRFELGRYEDAMPCFQQAKDEAKYRVIAAHMLGKCFSAQGWHSEAVDEFKEAIRVLDAGNAERELDVKYDLMVSLMELAKGERNAQAARDAAEICSYILRKNIAYRDIRDRRKQVDALVKEIAG
jgi:tetratricopeptide (TPR) repeat protein